MQKELKTIATAIVFLIYFSSCNSETSIGSSISTDTAIIAKGKTVFTQQCSGCHNFRQNGIGPQLRGLTQEVSAEWIHDFIKNPKQVIESGDERGQALFKKFRTIMPSFTSFTDDDINAIIAYIHSQRVKGKKNPDTDGKALIDPIVDTIKFSGMVINLKLITQFPPSSDSGKLPLTRITKLDYQPKTGSSFVLDLRGKLYKLQNDQPVVYMDMAKLRSKFINTPGLATGFGSFAFHPDFSKNGLIYTTHTEPAGTAKADFDFSDSIKVALQWVLTEWKTAQPNALPFLGEGRELFRINMVAGTHGVQEIAFNPLAKPSDKDYGLLYVCVGDGGSAEEGYTHLLRDKKMVWGTILRIDPAGRNSRNGQYGIPSDNPFTKDQNDGTVKEIFAYGFRNPHRITWSEAGQMLVCNIGLQNIESINIIRPGNDYGWPIREGNFFINIDGDLSKAYPLPPNDSVYKITYPVAQYDHDEGNAISGGYEYTGKNIPQLKGKFLFGDIPTGRLLYVNMADLKQGSFAPIHEWKVAINGVQKTLKQICGSDRVDLHFGKDAFGEMYIMTKADGKLYRLVN